MTQTNQRDETVVAEENEHGNSSVSQQKTDDDNTSSDVTASRHYISGKQRNYV